jgi:thioredoxin reductase (NADPH)
VLRLAGFLSRNGHPHTVLDPDMSVGARAMVERSRRRLRPSNRRVSSGSFQRNPSEEGLARCVGLLRPIDRSTVYDLTLVGAGPAGLAAAVCASRVGRAGPRSFRVRRTGGRIVPNRELPGIPTGIAAGADSAGVHPAQKFGAKIAIPDQAIARLRNRARRRALQLTLAGDELCAPAAW